MSSSTLDSSVGAAEEPVANETASATERTRSLVLIGLLTVAAAILWTWQLGSKSLYRDEAFTASTVLRPWGDLLSFSIEHEANGALHAGLLRAFSIFAGDSEAALRSLSVVAMVALIPAVAAVAWRLLSPRVAVLASALIVVNGSAAGYAQNARTYALSMVLATLATLFFVLDVEQPRRWTIAAFWGAGVLLAYSHIVGLLLLAALVGSLWFLPPHQRLVKRRLTASGLIVLASLPMAYLIATHDEGMPITGFRLGAFRDVLFTMTGRAGVIGVLLTLALGLLALQVTVRIWKQSLHSRDAWVHAVLILWAALPGLLLAVTSPVSPPLVIGRYLLFCLPALAIYEAIGFNALLDRVGRRNPSAGWLRVATAAVVLAVSAYGVVYWYSDGGEEDWRGTTATVLAATQPGDRVLFANDSVRLFFEYYRRFDPDALLPESVYPPGPWGTFETGDQTYESFEQPVIDEVVSEPTGRVWVVIGRNHDSVEDIDEVISGLNAAYTSDQTFHFTGDIEVQLWEPS
jgi:4-amino-4-deoxy-L-arabinose transferase-like glycosyltransferase